MRRLTNKMLLLDFSTQPFHAFSFHAPFQSAIPQLLLLTI